MWLFGFLQIGLKVGVKTRGCNGLSYTLDYTKEKEKSDEEVVQDGKLHFGIKCIFQKNDPLN